MTKSNKNILLTLQQIDKNKLLIKKLQEKLSNKLILPIYQKENLILMILIYKIMIIKLIGSKDN